MVNKPVVVSIILNLLSQKVKEGYRQDGVRVGVWEGNGILVGGKSIN